MRTLAILVVAAACTPTVGPEPPAGSTNPTQIFDEEALAKYAPADRAYVMGHALGVFLYGGILPSYVVGTGYDHVPGKSAQFARVPYEFGAVVTAAAGECFENCGGGGSGSGGGGGWIDEDCETFLDPAALEARQTAAQVDMGATIGELDPSKFALGVADALALEDLEENTDHSEIEHLKETVQAAGLCEHSPLVLDLAGDGIAASAPEVRFDLKATGVPFLVAWPRGDDALLAYDRDGDGRITSGAELFGNHGAANGFEALALLDNGDGVIDARDPVFGELRLWRDVDRDGASDGELVPLAAEGVAAIPLAYTSSDARDPFGNALAQHGRFVRHDGREAAIIDVWLRLRR